MDELAKVNSKKRSESPEVVTVQNQPNHLKVSNCSTENHSSTIPKRKLSVFYRSFDVIAEFDQEKGEDLIEFRRATRSPSVRNERPEEDANSENHDTGGKSSSQKSGFVNSCCLLIENRKFLNNSYSPDRLGKISCGNSSQASKDSPLSPSTFKLPRVREDTGIVDNHARISDTSIGRQYKLNKNGNHEVKANDGNVTTDFRHNDSSFNLINIAESSVGEKIKNLETVHSTNTSIDLRHRNSFLTRPFCSPATACTDLVNIKDPEHPRAFANLSSADRLGKYTTVDAEMSSHEDSSIGSDSEDDSIERTVNTTGRARDHVEKIERSRSKSNSPLLRPPWSVSISEPLKKLDSSEPHKVEKTEEFTEFWPKREKRQVGNPFSPLLPDRILYYRVQCSPRLYAGRRSLSEGDFERCHREKRRSRYTKADEQRHCPAFPSFNAMRTIGLSKVEEIESLHRGNISEGELERKYIGFSIGLSTDRITLHRRMALSLRQRDQSEKNFKGEIQKMQEDIQDLCSLCTDQESIDKVAKVREQLDMIERCVHGISCAAETLGAVYQEERISKAIYIGDKYIHLLRSRCENLATEITETKQILWKNNIVIEETSGEIGDDLPKIRYRNGIPGNNRTMVARRRASIATISRPLNSQDAIKETPRCCSQRNSVSGRVTLRRPSLCSEMQSSGNSTVELRDIFERTEPRRNPVEENNNLLRIDETNSVNTVNSDVANNTENKDRLITKQNSFLESSVTKAVEKQIKSCIRTAEPLRITRNIETWRPILCYTFIFFLGFYVKQIISTLDACDVPP